MADKGGGDASEAAAIRRAKIQRNIGQALLWSKGFAAEETKIAFGQVVEISGAAPTADERFAAYYGQWANSFIRSELLGARRIAEAFLKLAEDEKDEMATAAARRHLATTRLYQGGIDDARKLLGRVDEFDQAKAGGEADD